MNIVVFGGGGFIGGALAARLSARGHNLTLPVRNREKAKALILLPGTDVVAFDPAAPGAVSGALSRADAVVNLAGILNERRGGEFVRVHNEFVRVLCENCVKHKVRRFVQISALNAGAAASSEYLRSKGAAEQIIRAAPFRHVIIRPSVVFGPGDSLAGLFVRLAKFPFFILPCAYSVVQPLAVGDLVSVIVHALESGEEDGKTLAAGGPEKMNLAAVARAVFAAAGIRRRVWELSPWMSYCCAAVAEAVPGVHFFSRDNYLSARLPSVTGGQNDAARIVGGLTDLEAGLAGMFGEAGDGGLRARRRR